MMIVELMLVLMIVLFTAVGVDYHNLWNWVWVMGGSALAAFALYYGVGEGLRALSPSLYVQKQFTLARRRRMLGSAGLRTAAEERLEALDEAALEQHLARHPKDALAVEVRAERHKRAGAWADYAREVEYLLTIPNELSLEERCARYHELATLYAAHGRRERAVAALRTLIATHPRHHQATLARRRLAELEGTAPPASYQPDDFDISRLK